MMTVVSLVTRCDSRETLMHVAAEVVERRLAACAHVRGPIESVYRWQGVVTQAQEWELDALTTAERSEELQKLVEQQHPYETPAVVVTPVTVSSSYGEWLRAQCS
jgi:periplasmic divalent cation tolerance protein